jgi:hypothetical protein
VINAICLQVQHIYITLSFAYTLLRIHQVDRLFERFLLYPKTSLLTTETEERWTTAIRDNNGATIQQEKSNTLLCSFFATLQKRDLHGKRWVGSSFERGLVCAALKQKGGRWRVARENLQIHLRRERGERERIMLLQKLRELWSWHEIRGCPGRFVVSKQGDRIPPETLLAMLDQDWKLHSRFELFSRDKQDSVFVAVFLDDLGGGLITFCKQNGSYVHTLNEPSGLERKLKGLGFAHLLLSSPKAPLEATSNS